MEAQQRFELGELRRSSRMCRSGARKLAEHGNLRGSERGEARRRRRARISWAARAPPQALASSPRRKRSWIPVPPQIYCRGTMARSGWMIEQSCEPRPSLGTRPPPVASQPVAWVARGSPFLSRGCFALGKNSSGLVGGAVDEAGSQ